MKKELQFICLTALMVAMPLCMAHAMDDELTMEEMIARTQSKRSYVKKVLKPEEKQVAKQDTSYKGSLQEAVVAHNLLNLVNSQISRISDYELAQKDLKVSNARYDDFEKCNEKFFAPYFSNPSAVWNSLKTAVEARIEDYNFEMVATAQDLEKDKGALLAAADASQATADAATKNVKATKDARAQMNALESEYGFDTSSKITVRDETGSERAAAEADDIKDSDLPDVAVEWQAGYTVLNLFYPDQDKWGKRIDSNTSSLPLWEDQKYLYNEKIWKPKYDAIRKHCSAQGINLAMKEPAVSDKIKYDYYFYDKVKAAHGEFVAAATTQLCTLTPEMIQAPVSAPRPLPMVQENMMILTMDEQGNDFSGVYPQNPMNPVPGKPGYFETGTLWEEYKAGGYKNIDKKGELNTYFKVSSGAISPRAKAKEIEHNRLSLYLQLKENKKAAEDKVQTFLDAAQELANGLEEASETLSFKLPANIDYLKLSDLNKLKKILSDEKKTRLQKARAGMGEKANNVSKMTIEQLQKDEDLAYLKALEYDKDASVNLTIQKALKIEEAKKEANANKKLLDLMNKTNTQEKLKAIKAVNHPADGTCLLQTKGTLVGI